MNSLVAILETSYLFYYSRSMMSIYRVSPYFDEIYRMTQWNATVKFGQLLPIFMSIQKIVDIHKNYGKHELWILEDVIAPFDGSLRNMRNSLNGHPWFLIIYEIETFRFAIEYSLCVYSIAILKKIYEWNQKFYFVLQPRCFSIFWIKKMILQTIFWSLGISACGFDPHWRQNAAYCNTVTANE